jgi:HPt (histidine-containing phosphotransfer) domain-containing protein
MLMIDEILSREQFTQLDPQTTARLVAAVESDLAQWTARLAQAASQGDVEGARRARHALTGLCGAFGAQALHQACAGPLADEQARGAMLATGQATIAAIRALIPPAEQAT